MKKFVALSLIASAALGLAACTSPAVNNTTADTTLNVDDGNMSAPVDGNMTVDTNTTTATTTNTVK